MEAQAESEVHLREYLTVLRKRIWTIATVFVVVVTLAAVHTFRQRPVYESSAQIIIEKEAPNVLSIKELFEGAYFDEEFLPTQYKILQSRTLAQAVIDRLRLGEHAEFAPAPAPPGGAGAVRPPEARADEVVDAFLARLTVEPVRNTRLVSVKMRAGEPRLAALMANTLADLYIEQHVALKIGTTREAGAWLSEQATAARRALEESQSALQRFNETNSVISLEQRQDLVVQKLEELNSELTRARTARLELETRVQQLQEIRRSGGDLEAMKAVPQVMGNTVVQSLRRELVALEGELVEQANVYTPKHPKIVNLTAQIQALRQKILDEIGIVTQGLRNEYEVAVRREQSLAAALEEQKRLVQDLNQKAIAYGGLKREVDTNREIFELIMAREKETGLVGGIRTSPIRVLDRARVPRSPASPNKARALALAMVVGLVGGVGLAFFLEYLDDTVKDHHDLRRFVDVPFLGPVPTHEFKETGEGPPELIVLREPKSLAAESYRVVRTALLFSSPDNPPRILVVTSPGPQEGKSLTSINLAATMALGEKRVLLVDGDLRMPRLHTAFGVDNDYGLSSLIGGASDVGRALRRTPVPNLTLMTSGPLPPNPSELLGSRRMGEFLELLRSRFDSILIDCTPVIAVSDAAVLAARADGVVLVIKAGATRRDVLRRSKQVLDDVQAKIVGAVINQVDSKKGSYYYSPYYYSRYHDGGRERRRSPRVSPEARPAAAAPTEQPGEPVPSPQGR